MLIFGYGYTGRAFATRLCEDDGAKWTIIGTSRKGDRGEQNSKDTRTTLLTFDGNDEASIGRVRAVLEKDIVTHILTTAPPKRDGSGDPVLQYLCEDILRLHKRRPLEWVGYLSSTGVYGNRDGAVVDETASLAPNTGRSIRRRDAEKEWAMTGLPLRIFRLPGIYGPGRGTVSRVRLGRAVPVLKPGQVFNRIHVNDIVSALLLSIAEERRLHHGRQLCSQTSESKEHKSTALEATTTTVVYNVVDDEPAPQHVVVSYAYELLGQTPPSPVPFEDANLSAMAKSFYASSRRVVANKIKRELGWSPTYPSYREGFAAQVRTEMTAATTADPVSILSKADRRSRQHRHQTTTTTTTTLSTTLASCIATTPVLAAATCAAMSREGRSATVRGLFAFAATTLLVRGCVRWLRTGRGRRQHRRESCLLLVDNGSLRAASTINLRRIANRLRERIGDDVVVAPVSARWSDRVDRKSLGGVPAELLGQALERLLSEGYRTFVVVPLFFGPSRTVTAYLPKVMREAKKKFDFAWAIAPSIVDTNTTAGKNDLRVARILCDRVREVVKRETKVAKHSSVGDVAIDVLVVDHGSPTKAVATVRDHVAEQVRALLVDLSSSSSSAEVAPPSLSLRVGAASMERRPGSDYAFADPLLENALHDRFDSFAATAAAAAMGEEKKICPRLLLVVVALLFLSPGRHAGPGGDIAKILDDAKDSYRERTGFRSALLATTELVGSHPLLVEILVDRFRGALGVLL